MESRIYAPAGETSADTDPDVHGQDEGRHGVRDGLEAARTDPARRHDLVAPGGELRALGDAAAGVRSGHHGRALRDAAGVPEGARPDAARVTGDGVRRGD